LLFFRLGEQPRRAIKREATVEAPAGGDRSNHSSPEENLGAPSPVDPGDQDIDTAATNAYDEFASERGDITQDEPAQAQSNPTVGGDAIDNDADPIGLHDPASMPRGEDDPVVLERSPEFHDRPGSGKYR
jgi:hypothetical protein